MIDEFEGLFNDCAGAFSHPRHWGVGRDLAYGMLHCMGRRTLTGMLTARGKQFQDWTSAYRLFSKERVDPEKMFDVALDNGLAQLPSQQPIVVHMDDTIIKKTGRTVPGTAWRRDPLGPAFHTNFIWGQRFIQMSLALPHGQGRCQSRAIPIDFYHSPTAKRPRKGAAPEDMELYSQEQKRLRLNRQGRERMVRLRETLDRKGFGDRDLLVNVDGSYTNKEVLKDLPKGVTLIGRIRKDTRLHTMPEISNDKGRRRVYGTQLPTPEQIRQSDRYSWQTVRTWAAGKEHPFKVKVVKDVLWRVAGHKCPLQLVVIAPLGYRLTKSSKVLYHAPAYLICTDVELEIEKLMQSYVWRWEIEVNFRDEKTLLGCGQAQVRNPRSAENVPAFTAAIYGLLHLAAHRSFSGEQPDILPRPKWYPRKEETRHTTGDLLNNFKAQSWAKANNMSFSDFVTSQLTTQSLKNASDPNISAAFYMRN